MLFNFSLKSVSQIIAIFPSELIRLDIHRRGFATVSYRKDEPAFIVIFPTSVCKKRAKVLITLDLPALHEGQPNEYRYYTWREVSENTRNGRQQKGAQVALATGDVR